MLQVNFIMICILHKILVLLFFKYICFFSQHIMMGNPKPEEENIIKDVRNLFRLEKLKTETTDTTMKDITYLFRLEKENKETNDRIRRDIRNDFGLEKENKAIKDIILRDIRNLFEHEEEGYYKPVRVINFWSNNFILSMKVKVIKIKHYQLKNVLKET